MTSPGWVPGGMTISLVLLSVGTEYWYESNGYEQSGYVFETDTAKMFNVYSGNVLMRGGTLNINHPHAISNGLLNFNSTAINLLINNNAFSFYSIYTIHSGF